VAFFVLGFLTSVSELSVAINATIEGVPQVSLGNLAGASFVILLFIIPFLAILSKGINLKHSISKRNFLLALAVIILPVLLMVDGSVNMTEGILALLAYLTLAYAIQRQGKSLKQVEDIPEDLLGKSKATAADLFKILGGGAAIFIATHFFVEQAIYFADALRVPSSLIGLALLSIGTNVPELVVAIRSILKKQQDVAFGDYLGSSVANTAIFGLLAIANGSIMFEAQGFMTTLLLMLTGLTCLFFFARSKDNLSRNEGFILLLFYAFFLAAQVASIAIFSTNRLS
jgi:cation:H+ antiporter